MLYTFLNQFNSSDQYLNISCSTSKNSPQKLILHLKGSIEMYNTQTFCLAITRTIDELKGVNQIIIDLTSVNFISSSGIGGLIQVISKAKTKNIKITFQDKQAKFKQILDLLGIAEHSKDIEN